MLCSHKIFDKKLPLAITQKTGEVSADCLALGERIGQQNVSSSLQKSS